MKLHTAKKFQKRSDSQGTVHNAKTEKAAKQSRSETWHKIYRKIYFSSINKFPVSGCKVKASVVDPEWFSGSGAGF